MFARFARKPPRTASGHPWSFMGAAVIIIVWAVLGPAFHFGDTWQLVINTATTIITFLMVFLIQNTQNREVCAMNLKLDELIRAVRGAENSLVAFERMPRTRNWKMRNSGTRVLPPWRVTRPNRSTKARKHARRHDNRSAKRQVHARPGIKRRSPSRYRAALHLRSTRREHKMSARVAAPRPVQRRRCRSRFAITSKVARSELDGVRASAGLRELGSARSRNDV